MFAPPDRSAALLDAVDTLAEAGFAFDPDVAFTSDPIATCSGLACASVEVRDGHRTLVIAPDAFVSASRLNASLLEVWARYRTPRPGYLPDLARGALQVVRDGERVGVSAFDRSAALHEYRLLWPRLRPAQRHGLPDPAPLAP